MSIFTLAVLSMALAVAAFNNGGVILPEWNWCLIAVGGATTSLLFSAALLFLNRDAPWRMRVFLFSVLAALVLPTLGGIGYLFNFAFPPPQTPLPKVGLSLPAVILYFALGSGMLGLCRRPKVLSAEATQTHKVLGRRFSLRKR